MENSDAKSFLRHAQDSIASELVAIITARQGSKGLLNKNVASVAGQPLVEHTIVQAIEAGVFSRIVVTTDCPKVLAIAETFQVITLERPAHLATDDARSEDVVLHALEELGNPDTFVLLQPTSPLRRAIHIREAVAIHRQQGNGSVISVCNVPHHPYKTLIIEDESLKPTFSKTALSSPRQSLPMCVRQNGAIYVCDTATFRREKTFLLDPCSPYYMTEQDSLDIDCPSDIERAEAVFAERRSLSSNRMTSTDRGV